MSSALKCRQERPPLTLLGDLGVSTFLIRGYDPLEDALDYGRNLIPLTRELVRRRGGVRHSAAEWTIHPAEIGIKRC